MPPIRFLAAFVIAWQWCAMTALADPSPEAKQTSYAAEARPNSVRKARNPETPPPRQLSPALGKALPLPPRATARSADETESKDARPLKPGSSLLTGMAALAVVLGIFLAGAWVMRRAMPSPLNRLPSEVVEVLGRTPLATRQFAHLIRCGNKLLLVHLAPGSAETLTEITDPAEVDRIAGLCRQSHPQSTTANFRQIFQQFAKEKPTAEA